MNGSLAMRSGRLRTLLLVLVGGGMALSLYLLTSSQYHLKDAKRLLEACQQQKDSLLAQLQVVYEQKNRVEKSLQQEKVEHKKTQEDNQRNNFLRLQVQTAKVEVDTKLSDLQKEQLTLQKRYQELESQMKEFRNLQTHTEEKRAKLQTEYERNMRSRDEENGLLRGNLTLALQERDNLEGQVVQLNRNTRQLKNEFSECKKQYTDVNVRLKELSKQKCLTLKENGGLPGDTLKSPKTDTLQEVVTKDSNDVHIRPESNDVHAVVDQQQSPVLMHTTQSQINPEHRHPLPAPKVKGQGDEDKAETEANQQSPAGEVVGQRPSGLREQLQPPDFGSHHANAGSLAGVSSPDQVGGNQALPPPPQDKKLAAPPHFELEPHYQRQEPHYQRQEPHFHHQEEPGHHYAESELHHQLEQVPQQHLESYLENQVHPRHQAMQSQEQKDQDTLVRKPQIDQNGGYEGQDLQGHDSRGHDNMFMAGVAPWKQHGDLAVGQQPQISLPEVKAKANNNNHGRQEEDDHYPEDADDDNAEEQDDTLRDKNAKAFQDHDFEDNDGNDHNQAKEEGIVIAPK